MAQLDSNLKKVLALIAVAIVAVAAYYGTYLPIQKSRAFISAMRDARGAASLDGVLEVFSRPLDMPSPIGQEELVRNTANVVMGIIQSNDDPETISQLIGFLDRYYGPILRRGSGMSFGQNLYLLGAINETAFLKTRQPGYLEDAKKFYSLGIELGPKRPQPLYGLFDIYRLEGNVEKAQETIDQILNQWPGDDRVRQGFETFLEQVEELRRQ